MWLTSGARRTFLLDGGYSFPLRQLGLATALQRGGTQEERNISWPGSFNSGGLWGKEAL